MSTSDRTLFDHQREALTLLRQTVSDDVRAKVPCRVILQGPTGFGKTRVMGDMTGAALDKAKRSWIVVPMIQIVDQTVISLSNDGVRDVGVMQANHPMTNYAKPVQVCSAQTLDSMHRNGRLLDFRPRPSLVIIDECHKWFEFFEFWMAHPAWAETIFVGMTASPWTKGLGKHYKKLLNPTSTRKLIEAGFLSPFRGFAPSHPDLDGVSIVAGDYQQDELSKAMQKPKLIADAVEAWLKHAGARPTIVFAVDRAHAAALQEAYNKAGIPAGYIDANVKPLERQKIELQLMCGQLKVVVNIGCLTTGCDWPFVSCIQLCRPTKSPMLLVQMVGRGLRTSEETGKVDCLILDHTDTTDELGFVDDCYDRMSAMGLDDGTHRVSKSLMREKIERPVECLSCGAQRRPQQKKCWSCGFEAKRPSKHHHADGELVEMRRKPTKRDKQEWWSMFRGYALVHGKSEKWILAQYKTLFKVWPRGLHDEPMEPSAEVVGWLTSQAIAWRKAQEKRANANEHTGATP